MHSVSDAALAETRADYCRAVIRTAGDLVLKGFHAGVATGLSMKGPQDYLTETDAASEALIRDSILARFPGDSFFGEEGGGAIGERVWVVDPVDGTANFARGIPHFCISIAYVEKGVTEFGAIYNPALDELYFAERGRGASLNGKTIRVAATHRYDATTIEMGWSTRVANETYLEVVKGLLDLGTNVRRAGSGALALAYVADGRSDGYVELHMNSWDCLAGLLLVSEAGGDVCPFLDIGSLEKGGPVLAAAPAIAAGISKVAKIPLSTAGNSPEKAHLGGPGALAGA
ncbi:MULTISPECIES: inositol monophosphatase family protein [Rhizobium]|jgi:myo-inositol-1(or 4)-monophosphatase|uniref:inositol monophosphatase family protein n=1 Tax=Rhizobium TaxID=379 RepID=UPI0003723739|nr:MULTISPECIES: inositol monophosphatase [Rhizobium]MBY2912191.1 inositol monophosphatase [Rhizobium leguminosarum]MBY2926776.1 inositol monophosphatase [Rhizobium leguminosarum]MBY2937705.1 inositol monophosphatase [Rhizobium leguminosarum]MBY2952093.1 inositol monophosphatase [Rhizobium leguminosarum]MBY3022202.1 inositol monophosphatase [Rhizobium leguminosarum]